MGVLEVNAVSKWNASSETTVGLKGGATRLASSASHEMDAKNGCRFTLSMPSGPANREKRDAVEITIYLIVGITHWHK